LACIIDTEGLDISN